MKTRLRFFLSIFIISILCGISTAVYAKTTSPFLGHWQAIDIDGSDIRLTIAGSPAGPFHLTWTESYVSFCGGKAGIVRGTGWLNEDDPQLLEADLWLECFTTGQSLAFHVAFRYHPGIDSLSTRYDNGMVVIFGHPGRPLPPPPPLNLRVNYGHDWVESFYEAGHMVWITVTESDGLTVKATAEVLTEPKDFWDSETGFQTKLEEWYPAPPDIQPYDWVYGWVDNGASAQVQLGDIRGEVFIVDNYVAGNIEAPWIAGPVPVECLDWGSGAGPFNKDAGLVYADGADPYTCSWDPESEWDLQAWQDVGVGYFTPDGNWVANAFHAEHWMAFWTYDLDAGFWPEGEYSYAFQWSYTYPEPGGMTMDPLLMTVAGDATLYPGYALIQPWTLTPQLAWTGLSCDFVPAVHPDQPTRFVWGWVNDFSMDYDEAMAHFTSFIVEAQWQGPTVGSVPLVMGELVPFYNRDDRWEHRCALTEHPQAIGLRVNYGDDWVESFYEAGHTVWLEVRESDGQTVKATAEMLTEPKDFWGGETGFQTQPGDWDPALPDILAGDWVFASLDNGISGQVQIGEINGLIDLAADAIVGTISAPWFADPLDTECHPWGAPEPTGMKYTTVLPDGLDPYTCSWAGEWNIQPGQYVGVGYFGPDGHWVANTFFVPPPSWRDEFDTGLNEPWYWINENPEKWNLDEHPGYLRIYTAPFATGGENLLLRPVAEGDFAIETHLLFEPDTDFQYAGLVIFQDENNFLQLGRAHCDTPDVCAGNGIYFDEYLDGVFINGNSARVVDSPSEAYLRLERRGDMVRALFSDDGNTWIEIGIRWIPAEFQVNGVGLTNAQDYNTPDWDIPADFDYFELYEGWGFLPEGFHDFDQGDVPNWACNAGGWAVDPDERDIDLWVEFDVDGLSLPGWALAGEYRPDLEEAGLCVNGNCGFFASLWDRISSYEPHSVSAYARDFPSGERVLLSNSPKPLTCRTYDIYLFDTKTGETRPLATLADTQEYNPRWSPDGRKIVHDRWALDFSTHGVYITDVQTGESAPLAGAESGSYPTWSPNGRWIAFDLGGDNDFRLFIVPPEGGVPTLVREDAFMATWAPNGQRLAFHQPGDGSIRTVDLNGQNETKVAERGYGPAWSPDGKWIAFEVDGDLWKVRVDSRGNPLGQPLQLTSEAAWEGRPTWSQNSQTIAFHSGLGRDTDIWTVPASGGRPTWLTGAPEFGDYDPNYSPNGRYIAYSSFSPAGQAARNWVAAYTYDLPAGSLADGDYPYHFEFEWSVPEPGSFSGQAGEFTVSGEAPLYDGCVLLRGPMELRGVVLPEGLVCEEIGEINPGQPARFLIGWLPDGTMTYDEAQAHFNDLAGRVVWGDGMSAGLVRHQILPFSWNDLDSWFQYVCSFTGKVEL